LAAHDKYIEIQINNGKCLYKNEVVPGALTSDGQLVLQFVRGKADNPIIQGIIVYNAPLNGNTIIYNRIQPKRVHST
jgi:hypothetical protein